MVSYLKCGDVQHCAEYVTTTPLMLLSSTFTYSYSSATGLCLGSNPGLYFSQGQNYQYLY